MTNEQVKAISEAVNSGIGTFFEKVTELVKTHQEGEVALAEKLGGECYVDLRKEEAKQSTEVVKDINATSERVYTQALLTIEKTLPNILAAADVNSRRMADAIAKGKGKYDDA